jgi:outer membrane receptor for ferrienterochelin and colicins
VLLRVFQFCFLLVLTAASAGAQSNFHLKNEKEEPIEGAIVTFMSLNSDAYQILYSGRKGLVTPPSFPFPMLVKVQMMGYRTFVDTLKSATPISVTLKRAAANLGEVVVTGDYRPGYQAGSVHQIDVITREEIDRRGAVNVQDLLSQEINMQTSNDPAMGSSLAIQGTGGEHIKFLVDGVPLTGRKNGNIDLAQLNLNNIERVEIVKGPMSVLYGSDALGGVVNLITRKPKSGLNSAGFNTYYESVGTYNTDVSAVTGFGKATVGLNAGRNFFNGWSKQDTGRWQQWKPREQYFGDLRYSKTYTKTTFTYISSYFREEVLNKSEPVVTPYFARATDQNYRTWRVVQQLQATQQLSKSSSMQFAGAYSWYRYIKNTWVKDMVSLNEELSGDTLDDDTTTFKTAFFRAIYNWNPDSSAWHIMAGTEFNNDNAIGARIDGQEHAITDLGVFASVDYKIFNSLTLRPSLRYIYNSKYDAPLVPAFNIHYAHGNMIWRAGYSAGFRSPSLKELYLSFFDNGIHNVHGNPNIGPERSNNFTASAEYRGGIQNVTITGSVSAYYNAIRNRITLVEKDPLTALFQYDNLDEFYARGAEARLRAGWKNLNVETGFAYTGTNEKLKNYLTQADVAWYPEISGAVDYTVQKYKTTFSVFVKAFGERPIYRYVDNTPVRFMNEGYQLVDLSIRKPFLKNKVIITTGVKNLLNVTDVRANSGGGVHTTSGNSAMIAMGTNFFAKLSCNF